jgi:hypothetical protein
MLKHDAVYVCIPTYKKLAAKLISTLSKPEMPNMYGPGVAYISMYGRIWTLHLTGTCGIV